MVKAKNLVALCDSGDPTILQKMYGISPRQAQGLEAQARRLVRQGEGDRELAPERMVTRSQTPAQAQQEASGAPEATATLEDEAQTRARRIRQESYGLQQSSIASMRSTLATCERNLRAGYSEWTYQANLLRRTLEILEGTYA